MKKTLIFVGLFVFAATTLAFAQGSVTLTTYYPAPFGKYQEMRVMGKLGVGTDSPQAKVEILADDTAIAAKIIRPVDWPDEWGLLVQQGGSDLFSPFTERGAILFQGSDSGRGLFQVGRATNYFRGHTAIGDTSDPGDARLYIDRDVGIGTNTPETGMSYLDIFDDTTGGPNGMQIVSGSASADDPRIILKRKHDMPNMDNDGFSIAFDRSDGLLDVSFVNANVKQNPSFVVQWDGSFGNVGIGTTAPASRLDVGNGTISLGSGNISNAGATDTGIFIDNDGNIGLNKADPEVFAHVGTCSGGVCLAEDTTVFKVDGRADTGHLVVGSSAAHRNVYVYGYVRLSQASGVTCSAARAGSVRLAPYSVSQSDGCTLQVCYPGKELNKDGVEIPANTGWKWKGACHVIIGDIDVAIDDDLPMAVD